MDEHATFETQAVLPARRRRGNLLGIAIAGVLIAATTGLGVLGGLHDAPTASAVALALAPASPPEATEAATPAPTATPGPPYPASVLGLQVWSAAYVSKYGLNYCGGTFAVAGWYAAQPDTGCPSPGGVPDPALPEEFGVSVDAEAFCQRSGDLYTAPLFDENVAPISIEIRPGVAAPRALGEPSLVLPVVFVGTLAFPGLGCHRPDACQSHMVVDHVAWAAGTELPPTSSVLPRLLDRWPPLGSQERDALSARGIGYTGHVLLETLVDQQTLARIDPHVAKLLTAAAPRADRIWYRRVLGLDPALDAIHWVAIDDSTGKLIASGSQG
jgi:hypothetical protein